MKMKENIQIYIFIQKKLIHYQNIELKKKNNGHGEKFSI